MKLTELQEKWLQELESGKHQQTINVLFSGIGYCCLGVACKFVFNIEPERHGNLEKYGSLFTFKGESCNLPVDEAEKLGLRDEVGSVLNSEDEFFSVLKKNGYTGVERDCLAEYNDEGATFGQIAAAIRACPEAVFTTSE